MTLNRADISFKSGVFEYAGFGALLGFCHGVAESSILGAYGVALTIADVLLLISLYPILGTIGGAVLWTMLVSAYGLLNRGVRLSDQLHRWRWFLSSALWIYAAVGVRLAFNHSSLGPAVVGSVSIILASLAASLRFTRHRPPPSSRALLLLAVTILTYTSTVGLHAYSIVNTDRRILFITAWVIVYAACILAILFLRRAPADPQTSGRAPLLTVTILAVLTIGSWLILWPASYPWQVRARRHPASLPTQQHRPNVMLIVFDTVRADHMDLFGYERDTMPLLTEIVRRDFQVVETIMATAPSSLPSHGSMFTGMYSSSHGGHYPFVDDPNPPPYSYFMRDDVPTLAAWLGRFGYHTVGISSNLGVRSSYGLTRGFVDYDARSGPRYQATNLSWLVSFQLGPRSFASVVLGRLLPTTLTRHMSVFNPYAPPYRRARTINQRITAWIDESERRPFFMFVNYHDAHLPYVPVPWLDQRFSLRPKGLYWIGFPDDHLHIAQGRGIIREDELTYLRGQYDAELVYLTNISLDWSISSKPGASTTIL